MTVFKRRKRHALEAAEAHAEQHAGRLVLVDVRGSDERAAGFAPGSQHLPLDELQGRLGDLPSDKPIAFVCKSGRRSAIAAQAARKAGLDASNVSGGMDAWHAAGLQTDRSHA